MTGVLLVTGIRLDWNDVLSQGSYSAWLGQLYNKYGHSERVPIWIFWLPLVDAIRNSFIESGEVATTMFIAREFQHFQDKL
jgi:hypothetical protein